MQFSDLTLTERGTVQTTGSGIVHFSSGGTEPPSRGADSIYMDVQRGQYRSREQDEEIRQLKEQLEDKKEKRVRDVNLIIAHYYKKSR